MSAHACLLTRNYYLITEIDFKIIQNNDDQTWLKSQYTTRKCIVEKWENCKLQKTSLHKKTLKKLSKYTVKNQSS